MKVTKLCQKMLACLLAALLLIGAIGPLPVARADAHKVLTLGANLSKEQKQYILDFFNVKESEVEVIIVTNDDERALLLGQYTSDQIGRRTYSCALVNPTSSGGIQVKTANMNVVTSSRIASILSTSGVTNCEVLAAAPFEVSGTGALTGVMMAYETASETTLDPEQREMAIEESRTLSEIGDTIGQDEATLVVNDIKIRIVRDEVKNTTEVVAVVDETLESLQGQLASLASGGVSKLSQSDRQTLYDYGDKLSKMNYDYDKMKVTLQRVTNNTAMALGIHDPIQETFEDLSAEDVLPENSILRSTNDESMENITATNVAAVGDEPSMDDASASISWNDHTYALFDLSMTWLEADAYCRAIGGHLATVSSAEEQAAIEGLAAGSSKDFSWLGGNYNTSSDSWSWVDGTRFTYANWDENQPDGSASGEYWLRMANRTKTYADWTANGGKWNDATNEGDTSIPTSAFGFICEIDPEVEPISVSSLPVASGAPRVTGVALRQVGTIENGSLIYGTNRLSMEQRFNGNGNYIFTMGSKSPTYRYALADIYGNLLTDYSFYSGMNHQYGMITAAEVRENDGDTEGILSRNGKTVVPFSYSDAEALGPHWAMGYHVIPATADMYDYSTYSDPKQYYLISSIDVYFVDGDSGTFLRTLSRSDCLRATARGEYLNIENRTDGKITTYDRNFNAVWTGASYSSDFGDFGRDPYESYYDRNAQYRYGVADSTGRVVLPAFASSISRIRDNYVIYAMTDADNNYKYGIVTLDGEQVLPPIFDRINNSSYSPMTADGDYNYSYGAKGYFSVEMDGKLGYAVAGGELTFPCKYPDDVLSDRGVTANYTDLDGTMAIISADGVETRMPEKYSSLYVQNYTDGMLWEARDDVNNAYDLLDWHGEALLSGYSDFSVSGDGNYLLAQHSYREPTEVYEILYLDSEHPAPSIEPVAPVAEPTAEPAQQPATEPAQQPVAQPTLQPAQQPAASVDNSALITVLQNTITTLQTVDFDAHRDEIVAILESEEAIVSGVNADAAVLLTSAKTLVGAGAADADTTILLLQGVIDKLNGQ